MRRVFPIAFRQAVKTPGFSLTVVLTLALGIGATTAIFSLVEGVLLRPLPFPAPDRLVTIGDHLGNSPRIAVTAREIATYQRSASAFSALGAYITKGFEVMSDAGPEAISGARVTSGVFQTLGVAPQVGRTFTQTEDDAHQPVAVISDSLWLSRFHRDPRVLNTPLVLNHQTYSIVGVMPRGFEFPLLAGRLDQTQVWVPMSLTADDLSEKNAGMWGFHLVARLKDGVTIEQAARDADRVAQQVMREFPASMASIRIRGDAGSLREDAIADARPLLRTLFVAVAIVLLIACADVAGLMLVRAIRRRRDYAVRLALGARPTVILRESIAEGLILSLTGGVLGLVLAAVGVRVGLSLLPESMPRVDSINVDAPVVLFALLLSATTGAICSLAPAFAALKTDLIASLKESGRSGSGVASHTRLRSALVVVEIAIALMLLTLSGALLRSYQKMLAIDPGYVLDHAVVGSYHLPVEQFPTRSSTERFNRRVEEELARQPGVTAAGLGNSLPAAGPTAESGYTVEGESAERWKLKFAEFSIIDGTYFKAVGIKLLDGRYFNEDDRADSPLVVMVNESMAKHLWPGQQALGKRIHAGNPHKGLPWATVVGVVADTRLGSRDQAGGDEWYIPMAQPAMLMGSAVNDVLTGSTGGYIVMRSTLAPEAAMHTLNSTIGGIDSHIRLDQVQPMADVLSHVEAPRRFNTGLITTFAVAALLLSILGIYAVAAFSVSMRTQEIAVRMALGASRKSIAQLVLSSSVKLALAGCGLGVVGSIALSRVVNAFLFGVSAMDATVYLCAVVVMMATALFASAIPARRAASCDPAESLRSA